MLHLNGGSTVSQIACGLHAGLHLLVVLAMEHTPFIDYFSIRSFVYRGFCIAMSDHWREFSMKLIKHLVVMWPLVAGFVGENPECFGGFNPFHGWKWEDDSLIIFLSWWLNQPGLAPVPSCPEVLLRGPTYDGNAGQVGATNFQRMGCPKGFFVGFNQPVDSPEMMPFIFVYLNLGYTPQCSRLRSFECKMIVIVLYAMLTRIPYSCTETHIVGLKLPNWAQTF